MRVDQVPQEDSILEGHRRACYARDADGNYTLTTSRGWRVEKIANQQAVQDVALVIAQVQADVRAGRASALAWHMATHHLTPRLLAAQAGFWRWQVRRHLRPEVFRQLDDKTLQRYARALGLTVDELRGCDDEAPR